MVTSDLGTNLAALKSQRRNSHKRLNSNTQLLNTFLTDTAAPPPVPDQSNAPIPSNVVQLPVGMATPAQNAGLSGSTASKFNKAVAQLLAENPGVSVVSAKRTPERQRQLWAGALKKYGDPEIADNWVARPGSSKHETDEAKDLKYANDSVRAKVHAVAKKYGLHFPLANENWHIELLGPKRR